MTTKTPQPLTADLKEKITRLNAQHPATWTRGVWYPATLDGLNFQIQRTRSAGRPYLKVRKQIKVNLTTPGGEVISTRTTWEYFTVNLQADTITYQGW